MAIKIILVDDSGNQEKTVLDVEIQDMDWDENGFYGCYGFPRIHNLIMLDSRK